MVVQPPKKALGLQLPINLGTQGYFATNSTSISQISNNIQNLLLTRPGERRFNNEFGSSLYNLLFEMIDFDITKEIMVDTIQRDVNKFLSNTQIVDVELTQEQTTNNNINSIFISVTFRYNNTVGNTSVTLTNNRI